MRLWGVVLVLEFLVASLLGGSETGSSTASDVEIVDIEAGKRFQISLPADCFDEDGKVKLAIRVLKPTSKFARLGNRTLRDSLEVSRRRARSAPAASRKERTRRSLLDVTVDWSSDQVHRPLGRPLRRGLTRRVNRQRSRRPWRGGLGGGFRRRDHDRREYSTINVYPSSEVIHHHYDSDEELSENDVWHPRNQMRRGLGRRPGRRYYDSDDDSYDHRSRPRRNFDRNRTNRNDNRYRTNRTNRAGRTEGRYRTNRNNGRYRTDARRRSLRRRNESTTTGSDTETEEERGIRRPRRQNRVTGPVRSRYLNDFDEEIGGDLLAEFSLPSSMFPAADAPTRTNTRMRMRTTTVTSAATTTAPEVTTTSAMDVTTTPTSTSTDTSEVLQTAEPTLPAIDEAEIVTFQ